MENKKYVIGADIGGTTVKLGLFEEDGTLLEKWEIPTVIEGDGTAVLRDIAAEIQKCREKHNIPADGILGVGAGIPGPVTADGVVLGHSETGTKIPCRTRGRKRFAECREAHNERRVRCR